MTTFCGFAERSSLRKQTWQRLEQTRSWADNNTLLNCAIDSPVKNLKIVNCQIVEMSSFRKAHKINQKEHRERSQVSFAWKYAQWAMHYDFMKIARILLSDNMLSVPLWLHVWHDKERLSNPHPINHLPWDSNPRPKRGKISFLGRKVLFHNPPSILLFYTTRSLYSSTDLPHPSSPLLICLLS